MLNGAESAVLLSIAVDVIKLSCVYFEREREHHLVSVHSFTVNSYLIIGVFNRGSATMFVCLFLSPQIKL